MRSEEDRQGWFENRPVWFESIRIPQSQIAYLQTPGSQPGAENRGADPHQGCPFFYGHLKVAGHAH